MHEESAERIAAGVPRALRETFLRNAIAGLGQALEQVRNNPERIRRCNARTARHVVALIDDPDLLARVGDAEKRVSVRDVLLANPAWKRNEEHRTCPLCVERPILPTDDPDLLAQILESRDARLRILGSAAICGEQVIRTIESLPADEQGRYWRLAFDGVLSGSVRARVELAAGRIPAPLGGVAPWTGRNNSIMRRALDDETTHNRDLLELAVVNRHIPAHWDITDDEWYEALLAHDRQALESGRTAPQDAIERAWPRLTSRARLRALPHAQTREGLEKLLVLLEDADIASARTDDGLAPGVVGLLHRFPDLDAARRLGLICLLPRPRIAAYLLGRLPVLPPTAEMADILAVYTLGTRTPTLRALIDAAGRTESEGEHRATRERLIELLVETALPRELFAVENRVSVAAHRYVWSRLTTDGAVAAFAGLLDEWAGTLPELVETAQELAR